MATIITIQESDLITNSRADINTNFANLNSDKIETSVIDTDTALAANSDAKVPSQKAVKTYIDTSGGANASETVRGIVEEATDAEVAAGTATGGTGAKLFITPAKFATYNTTQTLLPKLSYFISTCFETAARFISIASSGTNTFDTDGFSADTTTTTTRSAGITMTIAPSGATSSVFLGSPVFTCQINAATIGTTGSSYFGVGVVTQDGTGHTYTTDHAGFKVIISSSVATLYATQGDGSTETASSALTTLSAGDGVELIMKINGTSSIDYYWRKNAGAWSSATNLTANMPNTADYRLQFSASNNSTGTRNLFRVYSASYSR